MLAASKMPITIGKLRSPSTSRNMITCDSWMSLMMIRFNSIWTGTGGLAFVGDMNRVFRAVDVKTGKELWQARLGTSVQGFPLTYSVNGKQYIAVSSGLGGGSPRMVPSVLAPDVHYPAYGNALYVFALPDKK